MPQATPTTHATEHAQPARVIRERDASKYIALSCAFLRQGRMHGTGPAFIRIGRSILYQVTDLDDWLNAHRVETREAEAGQ